jgi:hypothetical protein
MSMKLTIGVDFSNITFYANLLWAQIPKAQKDSDDLTEFFCFWDLRTQKLIVKYWWNWHKIVSNFLTFLIIQGSVR